MGCLIRVFDLITTQPVTEVDGLRGLRALFPPVFVGLRASVQSGRWKYIGSLPVASFDFPMFRATGATKPGTYESWWLWDGKKEWFIGRLPEELRGLEQRAVWGDELLEQRIATGTDPFAKVL